MPGSQNPKILVNDLDMHQPLADAFPKPYNLHAGLGLRQPLSK